MTLSQFCLDYIECRWVWAGVKPPLPARTSRWSFRRFIVFTLGQTLAGTFVGAIMAWLFTGLLGGFAIWLVWQTAAFSAYQGIISYGLTAIYWNQRAAQLRANPASGVNPPRFSRPFARAILGPVYFALLGIITPGALLLTVENVRGEILWRRERARLVAQGERLEYRELIGPAVPAEQNAGAAALFAPFFDYHLERIRIPSPAVPGEFRDQDQAVWHDTNALHRVTERLRFPESHWPKEDQQSSSTPRAPKVDLNAWAAAYRSLLTDPKTDDPSWVTELKLPEAPGGPAWVVLAGASVAESELAALCEASTRPRAQFPIHFEEAYSAQHRLPGVLRGASWLLQRRCAALLEIGEIEAAFRDADCALRTAELWREEPLLISQFVRMGQGIIATRTLWQGLAEHRWADTHLAAFQERLTQVDYLSGVALAFEGERAMGIQGINHWFTNPRSGLGMVAPQIVSRGMLRQNQVSLVRYQSCQIAHIRAALSRVPTSGLAGIAAAAVPSNNLKTWSPYNACVSTLAPAIDKAMARAIRTQVINRMSIVACALERYRVKHGVFPEILDALVPAFLPTPPMDPMNNQPFHYWRTDDGWYQFYSVGADGKDDGGFFKAKGSAPEKDWPWPVPTRPERCSLF
jgi:hypothetical protein